MLIVDANPVTAAAQIQILKGVGVGRIYHAGDTARALHALVHGRYDAILVNPRLGEEDGLELIRALRRESGPCRELPTLVVTDNAEFARVAGARDAGADMVLTWPISVTGLRRRLQAVLREARPLVQAESFVGPDRRRRQALAAESADRRNARPVIVERQFRLA